LEPQKASEGQTIIAVTCQDKKKKNWNHDEYGQIRSKKNVLMCITKANKALVLGECASTAGSKETHFIYNYWDNTILWKGNKRAITITTKGTIKLRKRKVGMTRQIWNLEHA
jgi:hypothetical protein